MKEKHPQLNCQEITVQISGASFLRFLKDFPQITALEIVSKVLQTKNIYRDTQGKYHQEGLKDY